MTNNKNGMEGLLWVIMMVPALYLMAVFTGLPETVPTHYDISGNPDSFSSKNVLWLIVAGLQLFIYVLLKFAPTIDPKGNFKKFESSYAKLKLIIQIFIALVTIILIAGADGTLENTSYGITFTLAILITMLGNHLQNVKPNYFVGVRTPWTLESEEVWKKTHRLTGRIWFFGGLLMFVALFFIPTEFAIILVVSVIVGSSLIGVVYSFVVSKQLKEKV